MFPVLQSGSMLTVRKRAVTLPWTSSTTSHGGNAQQNITTGRRDTTAQNKYFKNEIVKDTCVRV